VIAAGEPGTAAPALVAPAPWPRARVVAPLAVAALAVGALALLRPAWNPWVPPAVLAVATLAVGALALRHSLRLDPVAATTWRGFGAIALLLALGHLIRSLGGDGVWAT
jgi:hypothetical protein